MSWGQGHFSSLFKCRRLVTGIYGGCTESGLPGVHIPNAMLSAGASPPCQPGDGSKFGLAALGSSMSKVSCVRRDTGTAAALRVLCLPVRSLLLLSGAHRHPQSVGEIQGEILWLSLPGFILYPSPYFTLQHMLWPRQHLLMGFSALVYHSSLLQAGSVALPGWRVSVLNPFPERTLLVSFVLVCFNAKSDPKVKRPHCSAQAGPKLLHPTTAVLSQIFVCSAKGG